MPAHFSQRANFTLIREPLHNYWESAQGSFPIIIGHFDSRFLPFKAKAKYLSDPPLIYQRSFFSSADNKIMSKHLEV